MIEVIRVKDNNEAEKKAAGSLNMLLESHAHLPLLLLLAGGSSLGYLDKVRSELFSSHVILGMLDERYGEASNFAQLTELEFFEKVQERDAYFIDSRVQGGEELGELAMRVENAWKTWKQEHPRGKIIITQGVGPDGHTGGIMPHPKEEETFKGLFLNEERWAVGYDAKEKNEFPLRVTCTVPFFRMVDYSVLYMVGENKRNAFSRMMGSAGTLWETPARIVQEMKEVYMFTDIQ
jgi:6-phosphogluconolactonase/glucosamine-6-phosphate isomerase/deaminase